jgi:hypothetical protein
MKKVALVDASLEETETLKEFITQIGTSAREYKCAVKTANVYQNKDHLEKMNWATHIVIVLFINRDEYQKPLNASFEMIQNLGSKLNNKSLFFIVVSNHLESFRENELGRAINELYQEHVIGNNLKVSLLRTLIIGGEEIRLQNHIFAINERMQDLDQPFM